MTGQNFKNEISTVNSSKTYTISRILQEDVIENKKPSVLEHAPHYEF